MKKYLIPLAALFLASCDSRVDKDGYKFNQPEFERTEIAVSIVQYDTRQEIEAEMNRRGIEDPTSVRAFAVYPLEEAKCTIHIERELVKNEKIWLGHEMTHCIYGRWHS